MILHEFSTRIYKYAVPNWQEVKPKILDSLPEDKGYTDYFDNSKTQQVKYKTLVCTCINKCLEEFQKTIPHNLSIANMWFERSKKYEYHSVHNHGQTGWSAVLYVNFNPFEHKATRFFSPIMDPSHGGMGQVDPEVCEGDLVIFPAFMLHEAPINESDEERTIISFNIRGEDNLIAFNQGVNYSRLNNT